ncbi:hypothetical protein QBC45DRAFT_330930, partial [Copromyces sp. CBS 386.78]
RLYILRAYVKEIFNSIYFGNYNGYTKFNEFLLPYFIIKSLLLLIAKIAIDDIIAILAILIKVYFNRGRFPKFFEVNNRIIFKLYQGYLVFKAAILGRKFR